MIAAPSRAKIPRPFLAEISALARLIGDYTSSYRRSAQRIHLISSVFSPRLLFLFLTFCCGRQSLAEPLTWILPSAIEAESQFTSADRIIPLGGNRILAASFRSHSAGSSSLYILTNGMVLDSSFRPNGGQAPIAVQPDGKILAIGVISSIPDAEGKRAALLRVNPDGSPDPSFQSVRFKHPPLEAEFAFREIAVQPDGKILVGCTARGGAEPFDYGLARLNSDGQHDVTFNFGTDFEAYNSKQDILAIRPLADGKILVGGFFQSKSKTFGISDSVSLARLNLDGTRDTTFSAMFELTLGEPDAIGLPGGVYGIDVQSDGKILVAGRFGKVNGVRRTGMARLNPNGSIDFSFNYDPKATQQLQVLCLQPDGRALVSMYEVFHRILPDGQIDKLFRPDFSGNTAPITDIAIAEDGRIFIAKGKAFQISGQLRIQVPPPTVPVVLERGLSLDPGQTWAPALTIPANTAVEYVSPNFPETGNHFYRTRPQ